MNKIIVIDVEDVQWASHMAWKGLVGKIIIGGVEHMEQEGQLE